MSYYYKYNFISPKPIYALIQEELKSYFDTGAVDNLLFPKYVNKALRKLDRTAYAISEEVLSVEDFETRLPDNFYAVKEAWMCGEISSVVYNGASSLYLQNVTILPPLDIYNCKNLPSQIVINEPIVDNDNCKDPCKKDCPEDFNMVKINNSFIQTARRLYLLKPGNISARQSCSVSYSGSLNTYGQQFLDRNFTPNSSSFDSFDIRDNKFITNFRNGVVHLVYYSLDYDDCGDQMVPDNYRILEYVEKFLKYKVFETLTNQINDETFNQLQQKMVYAKQEADEAFVMASIEVKKETVDKKRQKIVAQNKRLNNFRIR